MLVGAVVVDDQVDVEFGGTAASMLAQESQELLMPVARLAVQPAPRR